MKHHDHGLQFDLALIEARTRSDVAPAGFTGTILIGVPA
jgi:hypothetical protein